MVTMEDLRRPRYRYDVVSRQAILDSISIFNPDVAKILIDECEIVATIHLHTIVFQANFPNYDNASYRITSILDHLGQVLDLVNFDGDSELAGRFWAQILMDAYGDVPPDRWDKFLKLTRSVHAARHLLRRASQHKGFESKWKENNSLSVLEIEYIKDLAGIYWHTLKRKPGRSKSTIGPFVRFAWAAMNPVLGDRMPTIDSLNDKWARLRFDTTKTHLNELSVKQFGRHYK
jgi:hypothetical protein